MKRERFQNARTRTIVMSWLVPAMTALILTACHRGGVVVSPPESSPVCDCVDRVEPQMEVPAEYGRPQWEERQTVESAQLTASDVAAMGLDEEGLMALRASHRVFFGILHSHTSYSDGSAKPINAFPHARNTAELDFLALTEHNHRSSPNGANGIANKHELYDGAGADSLISIARAMTVDGVFVGLYGQEFSSISSGNHVNVLDVPHVIDDRDVENGSFRKLLKNWLPMNPDSTAQPAVLQLNHPWNSDSPNAREYGRDDFESSSDPFQEWRSSLDRHARLIEVINGPSHTAGDHHTPTTISDVEYRRYLDMGFHLAPTANQDNHRENWGSSTDARTAVIATALTKEGVLEALRSRRVYATLDKNLRVFATIEATPLGSILTTVPEAGDRVRIDIAIDDDDEPRATYFVEVFADQIDGEDGGPRARHVVTFGPLTTGTNPGDLNVWSLQDLIFESDWDYLYLTVLQQLEGTPEPVQQAWLAPVWFERTP